MYYIRTNQVHKNFYVKISNIVIPKVRSAYRTDEKD